MLLLCTIFVGTFPLAAQDQGAQQGLRLLIGEPTSTADALRAYREKPYRPMRVGEAQAAAFLTEGDPLPFGRALGPTDPPKVRAGGSIAMTQIGSHFAVRPPTDGRYAVGDTLVVAIVSPGPKGWGNIVTPTGRVLVESMDARQTVTRILDLYGPMRADQVVLPATSVRNPGEVTPVPTDGPRGAVIAPLKLRDLEMPGGIMFSDLNRGDGIRVGDFVQIRREAGPRVNAADTMDEVIGTAQVVHVGARSSTLRLIEVMFPQMPAGSPVVRTATLPE
jgi:hypothetical protein